MAVLYMGMVVSAVVSVTVYRGVVCEFRPTKARATPTPPRMRASATNSGIKYLLRLRRE